MPSAEPFDDKYDSAHVGPFVVSRWESPLDVNGDVTLHCQVATSEGALLSEWAATIDSDTSFEGHAVQLAWFIGAVAALKAVAHTWGAS